MSTHGVIDEGDQHKADVVRDGNSREREPYKVGDEVKAEVTTKNAAGHNRTTWRTFIVTAVKKGPVSWQYQLKDKNGIDYKGGKWVPHEELEKA